ncbi:helix-turn-helix domain-containing protein [Bacillus sp. ISL-7]|uniref:helix-turn-helix domain-containing protein n=1 Tax=Bacillus sp. ISL-7 TaxID=2819136 RepID=UPI001BECABD0|nr:helix-turn-helix domain-containing protein [Bacillus sp. ISL-7]MBT2735327.1 helix-turn-helix domain-containing protein [Bacillus sp. ISL-7]
MNFKLELPEGTILINRNELKEVLQEMLSEMQNESGREEIFTIREAADYLKVSVPTVRKMIANKEIPFFQRGQVIRINRNDLQNWLRSNSKK